MQVRPVRHPRNPEIGIGPVREVQPDAGRVLEVEHAGQAVGHPCGMERRPRLEEQPQAGHIGPLRGVVQRFRAERFRVPRRAGIAHALVHVGARVQSIRVSSASFAMPAAPYRHVWIDVPSSDSK